MLPRQRPGPSKLPTADATVPKARPYMMALRNRSHHRLAQRSIERCYTMRIRHRGAVRRSDAGPICAVRRPLPILTPAPKAPLPILTRRRTAPSQALLYLDFLDVAASAPLYRRPQKHAPPLSKRYHQEVTCSSTGLQIRRLPFLSLGPYLRN